MSTNYEKLFYKDYELLLNKNGELSEQLRSVKYEYQLLSQRYETQERKNNTLSVHNTQLTADIAQLQKEIDRLKGLLNRDGTNSGTPTSQTPNNKKKVIPNSRVKTGKTRGGQYGHSKKKLERFKDEEVNERVEHTLKECPNCKGNTLTKTGTIEKDVLDYKVIVEKTRHTFTVYRCPCCGKEIHEEIPNHLKEENQYGPQVRSLALTLMNTGNVSINKVRKIIKGFTRGKINVSEGYLAKLQERASSGVTAFAEELRKERLKQSILYWDDSVIMINTARACLRFYGTERLALYKAHMHKDKEGLDKDNLLKLLSNAAIVVHDHNKVNYNRDYCFQNAECNEHLMRDLQKVVDNLGSQWASKLKTLLSETNKERNKKIEEGGKEFKTGYLSNFLTRFDSIMADSFAENKKSGTRYYGQDEQTLITRILDYKNEYLAWVTNFEVPFTNNLSERSLRGVKSKMKISGQFQNETTASYYADIRTYLETCNRNGVNEFYALNRLCTGNPLVLSEILEGADTG
jgi:rRNA maturation protein Nop10